MKTSKQECTGCGACGLACRHKAIIMKPDEGGCLYPLVDPDKCNSCGICDRVCHVQVLARKQDECPSAYAAYLKSTDELPAVSSGGAFSALAECVIENGGVVYGVAQDTLFEVKHIRVDKVSDLTKIRRSKYLQSDTGNTYVTAERDLKDGVRVLFSGTPCQIAGLVAYLGKSYDNLITCEVVCHGVPLWNAFRKYIRETENLYQKRIIGINYRDKSEGWNKNKIRISFEDGTDISEKSNINKLHNGYCLGLFYRQSCTTCKYASLPRVADITLADYWQYNGELKKPNNNCGISLVICNSSKGRGLFAECQDKLTFEETNMKDAVESCYHLTHSPTKNRYSDAFIRDMDAGFIQTYDKYEKKMQRNRRAYHVIAAPYLIVRKIFKNIKERRATNDNA